MSQRRVAVAGAGHAEADHYWMSYSDLMAGVLLMFILLLVLALNQTQELQSSYSQRVAENQEMRLQIEQQLGVSQRIIKALQDRLKASDQPISVSVDPQTGAIRFGEGILFDYGSARLTPTGRKQLDRFFPLYAEVLLGEKEFRGNLAQIIVEGHTDSDGGYLSNLTLSQARASAVAEYLLTSPRNLAWRGDLEKLLTANGRSKAEPIASNDTDAGRAQNRRIEFKFRLRDADAFAELQRLLDEAKERDS